MRLARAMAELGKFVPVRIAHRAAWEMPVNYQNLLTELRRELPLLPVGRRDAVLAGLEVRAKVGRLEGPLILSPPSPPEVSIMTRQCTLPTNCSRRSQ
jgi:hypothetical protein